MLIHTSILESLGRGALDGIALSFSAFTSDATDDKSRIIKLASVGVLLVLLAIVLLMLMRAVRKAQAGAAAAAPAQLDASAEPRLSPDEADLTRMRAFTPDLLPKLSLDDNEGDEDDQVVEDSKPSLTFEGDAWLGIDEPTGPHDLIVTAAAGKTDRGVKRTRNEDALLSASELDLYIVADGMGGYAGGDVAANTAVAEVKQSIEAGRAPQLTADTTPENCPRRGKELIAAVAKANEVVHGMSAHSKELHGMGTTIIAARFSRRKQRLYVAHVGDSRLYRLRAGKLQTMTTDHTLGAKGVTGPLAANVRRAVGVNANVKVDILVDKPLPEDLYLLCSDGMYKMLKDAEIARILSEKRSSARWSQDDLNEMVESIVKAANAAGGRDNITVIIVGVRDAAAAERSAKPRAEARA
jgi:protein phosphatase